MGMNVEIPVFIETNLGTSIVIPISEDITASSLQREIERAHIDIFPELGFLSIHALTVKRDSKFYRLPESFPVKYAFEGFQTIWLLHADVSRPKSLKKTSLLGNTVSKRKGTSIHVHNGKEVNRKKRRKERCLQGTIPEVSFPDRVDPKSFSSNNKQKISEPCVIGETPCESNSGAISVSGIIDRYFKGIVEVGEVGSAFSSDACMKFGQNPLPPELSSVSVRRYERSEVGKRLVIASGSLSRCQNSRGSSLLKDKRLQGPDDCSIVRNLVFEIDDND
ncbi:uncharacterized protein LOC141637918 [Silene latifolia]|uniref:uncharacterized protein LOC141637918 n=1 Tax=Silene latifolia TaxID=37657 RepID=UPI003D778933